MTRENKLALVVGFGLILFVGILISDHFSTARMQTPADFMSTSNKRIIDPLGNTHSDEASLIDLTPQNEHPIAANPGIIEAQGQRTVADSPKTQLQDLVKNGDVHLVQNPEDGLKTNTGVTIDSVNPGPVGESIPLNWKIHEVQAGESFYAICRQYYGDVSLVKNLAKANRIDDPGALHVGQKLRLPPATEIGGKSSAKSASPSDPTPSDAPGAAQPVTPGTPALPAIKTTGETRMTSATSNKPTPSGPASTYTVKSGDSLASIAQRFLGSKSKWKKIYDLNRQVIDDPDDVKVGTVLKLL